MAYSTVLTWELAVGRIEDVHLRKLPAARRVERPTAQVDFCHRVWGSARARAGGWTCGRRCKNARLLVSTGSLKTSALPRPAEGMPDLSS